MPILLIRDSTRAPVGRAGPKVSIGNLKSTLGDQNYEVPSELPTDRIRSIVIWFEPVSVAYIAAPLGP